MFDTISITLREDPNKPKIEENVGLAGLYPLLQYTPGLRTFFLSFLCLTYTADHQLHF